MDRLVASALDRVAKAHGTMEVFAAAEGMVLELGRHSAVTSSIAAPPETARVNPALRSADRSVLVAVVDPRVSQRLSDAIHADGLRLLTVQEGNTVASLVQSERPSLIIVQRGLKDVDALQLCRALRRDPASAAKDVPIVMAREGENPAEQQREAEAGITDWLIWPFSETYARTRVRAWLLGEACRWKPAPLPPNEDGASARCRRWLARHRAGERFDRYTRIAAALFDVPVALVSLVDRERQWFKSRLGIDATETARDSAFCAHAILGNDAAVPDALQDDRFADNLGDRRATRPLLRGGTSRCKRHPRRHAVRDRSPARNPDDGQLQLLRDLAKLVEREFQTSPAGVRN
jgi:CheY-like chemotaxis protein